MRLCEWLDMWLSIITPIRSPRTIDSYRHALKHLPDDFKALNLQDVTPVAWQLAINTVYGELPRQAQILHAALRAAWRMGQKQGIIPPDRSPWQYVAAPVHHSKPILYLTPAEMSSYARAARDTEAPLPLLLMLLLGLRRGEVLGLKWSQIDERSMYIMIDSQIVNGTESKPKSRASVRQVPICAEICALLAEYGDKTSRFCYNGGVKRLYTAHAAALAEAQLPPITLHGLRHSCATAALAAGAPITAVQHLLGHRHYATTANIYSHALLDPQRNAVLSLCRMVS